jgi:hypothetical protein
MTAMRESQVRTKKVRVLLGGKIGPTLTATPPGGRATIWCSGRTPGVVEEALASLRGTAAVLDRRFSGATRLVIDLLEGRSRTHSPGTFKRPRRAPKACVRSTSSTGCRGTTRRDDRHVRVGRRRGAVARNGLSEAENRALAPVET